jgi:hypothetical protein
MKLNDPTLWPAQLGDLHFRVPADGGDCEMQVVSDGEILARLFRHDACSVGALVQGDGVDTPVGEAWELVMEGSEDEVLARELLFRPAADEPTVLSDEIVAWATLTVLSRLGDRRPGRG